MNLLVLKLSIQVHLDEIAEAAGLDVRYVSEVLTIGGNNVKPQRRRPTGYQFKRIACSVSSVLSIDYSTAARVTRKGCLNITY